MQKEQNMLSQLDDPRGSQAGCYRKWLALSGNSPSPHMTFAVTYVASSFVRRCYLQLSILKTSKETQLLPNQYKGTIY
jgi:hypothetical protein